MSIKLSIVKTQVNTGILKGEAKERLPQTQCLCASPLSRLGSARTIRKVLGDSLHTFSSVRKYGAPQVDHKMCFDLHHKPVSAVPLYADESGLLVLTAFVTSVSLSKKSFLTD